MSGEGEGTYVCTLDDSTLKKAKDELNEDPVQRASQIETFRQWVKSQPHLKSRTGKFNQDLGPVKRYVISFYVMKVYQI